MKSPADQLVALMRSRGLSANPDHVVRLLGRGAITPDYIFAAIDLDLARVIAERIKRDSWDNYRHRIVRTEGQARKLAYNFEVDAAKAFERWAKRQGLKLQKESA